jgi:GT2 family glycosyltransferase
VPTHERADLLPRLVNALAEQTEQRFELVIVDDGSTDHTWATLQELEPSFRLVPIRLEANGGPAAARNVGWRAAHGALVAFTDDDCVPSPDWLAALVEGLDTADIVQGRTALDEMQQRGRGPFSRTVVVDRLNWQFETCNIAYRRSALERVGGFDERFRYARPTARRRAPVFGEDTDLAWRAIEQGAASTFAPRAVVTHDISGSSFGERLLEVIRAEGLPKLLRRHPQLRQKMYWRWFFLPYHPPAILAAIGSVVALLPGRSARARLAGVLLVVPYIDNRMFRWPIWTLRRKLVVFLPMALAADLTEVAVLIRASLRERTLLL